MSSRPSISCQICKDIAARKCPICQDFGSSTLVNMPDGRQIYLCTNDKCSMTFYIEGDYDKYFEKYRGYRKNYEHLKPLDGKEGAVV